MPLYHAWRDTSPDIRQKMFRADAAWKSTLCGKTEIDDPILKQTRQATILRLQDILHRIEVPRPFDMDSHFHIKKSNVMQLCHSRRFLSPKVPNVLRNFPVDLLWLRTRRTLVHFTERWPIYATYSEMTVKTCQYVEFCVRP